MTKSRRIMGQPDTAGPSSTDGEVERALEKIRDRYRIGRAALAALSEGSKNDGETIGRLAAENKLSKAEARHSRLFAQEYTGDELEALLRLRKDGLPLSWDHVKELLRVKSKAERTALQEKAARSSWSSRTLRTEIRAKGLHTSRRDTARRAGGLRHAPARNPRTALVRILDFTKQWSRYYKDAGVGGANSPLKELSRVSPRQRKALLQKILEAKSELEALRASVAQVLRRLQHSAKEIEEALRVGETPEKAGPAAPKSSKKARPQSQEAGKRTQSGPRRSPRKRPSK